MARKKPVHMAALGILTAGTVLGTGSLIAPSQADAEPRKSTNVSVTAESAHGMLINLYSQAANGASIDIASDFTIGETTRADVIDKIGQPYTSGTFDTYHAEMGNPGFHFKYNQDGILKEIRYLGTNVERKTNLGSITPAVLEQQIGKADTITSIPSTDQHKYSYETGSYQLEFIVNDDTLKVDHVNLVTETY
ncbi:YjgB family protein [Terribacillus halophilus]|uniref:YjgB family protein n=1 Tax=Terribacillus halophilus TaxID=361279 RepID=UPI00098622C9|nr:YjgB family protein [Terribacillus halophilus]